MEEELKEGRYRQAKTLGEMLETDDDRVARALCQAVHEIQVYHRYK